MQSNAVLKEELPHKMVARTSAFDHPNPAVLKTRAVALAKCFSGFRGITTDFVDENIRAWESLGLPSDASDLWPVLRRDALGSDYEVQLRSLMVVMRESGVMKYIWPHDTLYVIRPEPKTVLRLHELAVMQKGSIIFVPVDIHNRHKGRSVLDARSNMLEHEFGLGSFEMGCALLWQRDSLSGQAVHYACIGDTYRVGSGSDTKSAPTLCTEGFDPGSKGKICYSRVHVDEPDHRKLYQIVTGFTPE